MAKSSLTVNQKIHRKAEQLFFSALRRLFLTAWSKRSLESGVCSLHAFVSVDLVSLHCALTKPLFCEGDFTFL